MPSRYQITDQRYICACIRTLCLVTRNVRFPPLDQTFDQTRSSPVFLSRAREVYFYTADVCQDLDTQGAYFDVDVEVNVDVGVGVGVSYMHGRVHTLIIAKQACSYIALAPNEERG